MRSLQLICQWNLCDSQDNDYGIQQYACILARAYEMEKQSKSTKVCACHDTFL